MKGNNSFTTSLPVEEYYSSAVLEIGSNDPDESLVEVALGGVGVAIEVPPSEQIGQILDFINVSVDDGKLVGNGPGKSGEGRLNALINMIEAAGDLIEGELFEDAHQQLQDAYNRTDSQSPPPDFVTGEAASELADRIQNLMRIIRGAVIITVDGLSFVNTLLGPPYLEDSEHYLQTALEAMNISSISDSRFISFTWTRDAGNTDWEIENLRQLLRANYDLAKEQDKKFIVIGHSWGTILSYLALSYESTVENPIHCDLYVALSSPLGTYFAHDPPPYPSEIIINGYVNEWLSTLDFSSCKNCYPRTAKFVNFWAWGDLISGPLNPVLATTTDIKVDDRSPEDGTDYRNTGTTDYWHDYTTLQPDHPDNEFLRNAVEDLIIQTLRN